MADPAETRSPSGGGSRRWLPVILLAAFAAAFISGREAALWSGISGLVLAAGAFWVLRGGAVPSHPLLPAFLGFGIWSLLSAIRSPCPAAAFFSMNKLAACGVFAMLATVCWEPIHQKAVRGMILAAAAGQAVLLGASLVRGEPLRLLLAGNLQYAALWLAAAALLAWGEAFSLKGTGRILSALIGIGLSAAAFVFPSRSGALALAAGALFLGTVRHGLRGLAGALLLLALLIGIVPRSAWDRALKAEDPLAWKRGEIWAAAWDGIREKPLLGWGPGQFGALYQRHGRPQEGLPTRFGRDTPFAHNDYLQAAAEAGIPALVFLLWGTAAWLRVRPGKGREGAWAALGAVAVFCLFNFPFAHPADGFLAAALIGLCGIPARGEIRPAGRVRTFLAAGLILFVLGNAIFLAGTWSGRGTFFEGTMPLRRQADRLLHDGPAPSPEKVQSAENLLRRAAGRCRSDADVWHDLFHLYSAHGAPSRREEARRALEEALRWKPRHAPWRLESSRFWEEEGNLDGARAAAREALRLEPGYNGAALQTGHLLRRMGRPDRAEAWLRAWLGRAVRRPPSAPDASPYEKEILSLDAADFRREIARARMDRRDYPGALRVLEENGQDPSVEQALLEAGAYYLSGRGRAAEARLRRGLSLHPGDAQLLRRYESLKRKGPRPVRGF